MSALEHKTKPQEHKFERVLVGNYELERNYELEHSYELEHNYELEHSYELGHKHAQSVHIRL